MRDEEQGREGTWEVRKERGDRGEGTGPERIGRGVSEQVQRMQKYMGSHFFLG